MIDLQKADQDVEKIYRFIQRQKNGIAVDDIANQYPPRDCTVPSRE